MAEIAARIQQLKQEKNALILAHVYTTPEIQDLADFVGDSLGLSRKSADASVRQDKIIFCGVYFMAETAALLSPQKKVFIPELNAGCPMADMADADGVVKLKNMHPGAAVVTYVNSTAAVKAVSDICVTSANAVDIVRKLPQQKIIFVPDRSLGAYVAAQIPDKEIILWPGFCPTHHRILAEFLARVKAEHPQALILAHPENNKNILDRADFIGSTGQMQRYAAESAAKEFIIASENGLLHRLRTDNPAKKFYPVTPLAVCPNMKKNTPEKLLNVLENETNLVTVEQLTADKARQAIQKMLELS
ncbi:quinolinate synthase [Candidatus Termititenax aidoneus]|uniref:Quinolinate synthase n=1 Tax=Termititenax aidoneus TaxID=2218524 RepID=A0A388TCG5_TERA1|nr:quinolinate synthase [Candidatus Termititenax aidoneus]